MPDEAGYESHSVVTNRLTNELYNPTMSAQDNLTKLAEQFDLDTDRYDVSDIPSELVTVMEYIADNTGTLGDYNEGKVFLGEGGGIIQWYSRSRYFSSHDNLLQWVQEEADDVMLGVVGWRPHPDTGEPTAYAEIHPTSKWGYDDE